ncbi:MAG: phosphoribosylformylglycinamidine synthase, purS protein [Nitrosopumilus sp. D6]|nr:MAG: phosphoribosylformylglycinamidine synthase, purS protein [Nitrosopumilus sp. D6]
MPAFVVSVTIENKPGISDPEGETILNDLVLRGSSEEISRIRTAKMLKFTIIEADKESAGDRVEKICNDLRIFNPLVSSVSIGVSEQAGSN